MSSNEPPGSTRLTVVRFHHNPSSSSNATPNYASRAVQYRLLVVVFTLMIVFVLMGEAAKPSNWYWLSGSGAEQAEADNQALPEEKIDTRIATRRALPSGVVLLPPVANISADSGGEAPLGINLSRFQDIQDDTVFQAQESELWFETLAALGKLRQSHVALADAPRVGFTQLFRQPDQYRGKFVTVRGTVRRAHFLQAHQNEQQISGYWQCWLFPDGTTNPIVVYALKMPAEFPQGMALAESVTFHGVFFKRWAYQAQGGLMTAPLVLAATGAWQPPPTRPPVILPSMGLLVAFVIGVSIASGLLAWAVYRQSIYLTSAAQKYSIQAEEQDVHQALIGLSTVDVPHPDDTTSAELARRQINATPAAEDQP